MRCSADAYIVPHRRLCLQGELGDKLGTFLECDQGIAITFTVKHLLQQPEVPSPVKRLQVKTTFSTKFNIKSFAPNFIHFKTHT